MKWLVSKSVNITTAFYTRKVKFTSETFCEKFSAILDGFPRLQDVHPFRMTFPSLEIALFGPRQMSVFIGSVR